MTPSLARQDAAGLNLQTLYAPASWFGSKVKCSKCGGKRVDVRPNWQEAPGMPDSWEGRSAWDK
jgi:hypothetical protein